MLTKIERAVVRRCTMALTLAALAACAQKPRTKPAPEPDLVNVGYGTQERSRTATSVSSVDAGEHPVNSWEQLLAGRIPGLEVVNGPAGMTFRIRGVSTMMADSDPLVILDGTPLSSPASLFGAVNPHDVKRIEVLKDAGSTAIYGSRGANGVIIVTTKKR